MLITRDHQQQIEKCESNKDVQIIYNNLIQDKESVVIYADKVQITQVITNLLENAINVTKQGKIIITVDKETNSNIGNASSGNDKVIVNVKNTGNGIHQDILPRLFSKYTTKSVQGIGLGLFISKRILDVHGCNIWAEKNADGKGSTFTFNLPCST